MSFFETDFISSNMTHLLFSYGTLQFEKVQLESFGRILKGSKDSLPGYKLENLKITDNDVLSKSAQQYHPIAIPTKNKEDIVSGVLFEITEEELRQADLYELSDYKRIKVTFTSNQEGWVYVKT